MTRSTDAPGIPASPGLPLDLQAAREKLASLRGPAFWRGIEELADDGRFQEFLEHEFPRHAADWDESLERGWSRRRFFELSLASLGLAGLAACTRQPFEKVVPYVKMPEEIVPGNPLFYATAMTVGGFGLGLLAESHEGRPTKVEGNPEHPSSLGGATALAQASVLGLYDPDRAQAITKLGDTGTWAKFAEELGDAYKAQQALGGAGLRLLTGTVTSPTLAAQIKQLLEKLPKARWIQWEPAGRDAARAAAQLAYGQPVETRHDFGKADVVLALESNFLAEGPFSVRYAKDFSKRRRLENGAKEMSRLYVAESTPTPTGTVADHRLPVRVSALGALVQAVGAELGLPGYAKAAGLALGQLKWVKAAAADLKAAPGRSVVIAGEHAPVAVQAAVHELNEALGNVGKTVLHTDPVEVSPVDQMAALRELTQEMADRKVDLLLILDVNPVYDAPADVEFGKHLLKVPFRAHLGPYADETAAFCPWQIPGVHYLEGWSDVRSLDGTVTIVQPLVEPLYDGRSAHEVLSVLLDDPPQKGHDVVRKYWQTQRPGADFEAFWRKSLHDGVVAGTELPAKAFALRGEAVRQALADGTPGKPGTLELVFRPDPSIGDGRFANNGWLQELPKPLSKLTWDNAAIVSPATAQRLGIANEQNVRLTVGKASATLPALIQPGQAEDVVTVHLGFGRTKAGRVGNGVGVDVTPLRTSAAPWLVPGATLAGAGGTTQLSHTQQHFRMEGRELLRVGSLETYGKQPDFARKMGDLPPKEASLYPGFEYKHNAWGLSVDLASCTGCNACVIACQAENNIPIVGKEQVRRNREMHWIRIDQYYEGTNLDQPEIHHQPVMCQHCENAPCEVVCPVAATVHGPEGLNEMAYNRCVGTRYCSNNCPYKVRRFNFLEYNGDPAPVLKLLKNPEVTVRSRGVMEKCTFCIQRINRARIVAEREGRPIKDGEIRSACQQTCPADAIVFGNINDPLAKVSSLKKEPRTYWLLDELNTRPRTSYLAKVRNTNPELEAV